jgi:SAM-dependent methyltransferase
MENKTIHIFTEIANYYSMKLAEHGESARGVDWNGEESQTLRFEQLCKLIKYSSEFTVNDFGCGYGALYEYLSKHFKNFSYYGTDISENMIQAARQRYAETNAFFVVSGEPNQLADYGIASGIFNVRLETNDEDWKKYIVEMLDKLDRSSKKGFAFNCLTSYSDMDKMRKYLYYADPCALFDHCKRNYSRDVAILHDYNLYEFTIIVRK